MHLLKLTVNGQNYEITVQLKTTLLEVLRDKLQITSPKAGCNQGDCGTCSVLVDSILVKSCLTNSLSVQGKKIITVEGLAKPGEVHPLQQAFHENYGAQCGFCTPGMILAAKALLDKNPNPTREDVKVGLSGNLCRCTGYTKIIDSVIAASEKMVTVTD
ncbi:MAG: (2Fe-2S)-binding protein [Desulfobacterales bacterium]|nr:(2Fe-2S)-binding protein [Desulfobacterales bacterium]